VLARLARNEKYGRDGGKGEEKGEGNETKELIARLTR
jgi:hypothetical protein